MSQDDYTNQADQVEIAWRVWTNRTPEEEDISFAHVLGFAIQEAYTRYENWQKGFMNDNMDKE